MKLWIKVFLFSLTFMVLAVDIAAYTILTSDFSSTISRQTDQAMTQHESMSTMVSGQVLFERLRQSRLLLSSDEVTVILSEITGKRRRNVKDIYFYYGDQPVSETNSDLLDVNPGFCNQVFNNEQPFSVILDYDNKTYILCGSHLTLEGNDYVIFTTYDVSNIYNQYNEQLRFVQIVSLGAAGITATILLLFIYLSLKPLTKINQSIRQIAKGDYSLRLKKTGGQEFQELVDNINIMAQSIEQNVKEIQRVADGRKRFNVDLTHEMKTPLTSIMGFADILRIKRSVTPEERQEYASIIVEETKRLRSLSDKLLELTQVSQLPLDRIPLDADSFISDVCTATQPLLAEKQLELTSRIQEGTIFYANPELFKSLLYNVIENAVKASGTKQTITIKCSNDSENVFFSITDQGIGMTPEEIENATDLFYTINPSRSKQKGGINVGIGLALCKEIAIRHNGTLKITSPPTGGTTISITLPRKRGD